MKLDAANTHTPPTDEPTSPRIVVKRIEEKQHGTWEAFLDAADTAGRATLNHRIAWDRVWSVYGLESIRLAAMEGDRVVGVLPLVQQKSMVFGNQMVSLPWVDAAGVLTESPAARDALIAAACEHARRAEASRLHLRQLEPFDTTSPARTDKVLMRLALPDDSETLWDSFSPKVRNQVRKAEKSGLSLQGGGAELLDEFFRVYAINMRDLGSPSHSRRFFAAVLDEFAAGTQITLVRLNGQTIGAGLTLAAGDTLEIPWASSLRQHNSRCVNHQLYWELLRQACAGGYRWFHFGRSTLDSGTYRFKRQWGAEPHTLHWYNIDPRTREFLAVDRAEESYGMAQRLWTRLPLWLSCRLGPRIIRHVA